MLYSLYPLPLELRMDTLRSASIEELAKIECALEDHSADSVADRSSNFSTRNSPSTIQLQQIYSLPPNLGRWANSNVKEAC